ncbi:hypothetical protein A2738_03995 [Candidatus Nomurabacteria bacterium RIFCSPHIGHO2_01_FULL_42_15]|uniref:Small-conductance mechanosensitive ion channel n=1 Tax=Candidatus Nomurabacteria bacterium RIFCSPHIGHO2_01_FULL_42_15 TaxID=1801742 RepID=A0A1F6VEH7_9BACT|nr:MAG: hypothetical protein A2738_03995 [Candidatus Nomurabacteria bacterium RIFCSPHIGHO2_01_FULL_42_15]OGI93363.1 MAG: hypothetical protein A3A99_03850 [Candidatus Nomurabacteria bacterium RIFCSPLOWO2_01_FULL_41_18]
MDNIWITWGDVFNASLQELWWGFIQFTPKLLIAIIFFVVGWIIGNIIARALEQVFNALKIDNLLKSVGVDGFFRKAGMNLNSGYFIGQLAKWFVIIVFLLPSLSLVFPADPLTGTNVIASFLQVQVLGYLVKVIIAALILIIAAVVSQALSNTVTAGAKSMGVSTANLFGTVAKYAVWIFAFIIALGQLGVADYYMSVLFTGIIAMISIGGALAFGLGGKDAAARFISKVSEEVSQK